MSERLVQIRRRNSIAPVLGPVARSRSSIMEERLPYSSRLAVILTDRCNIECAHCLPECGPKLKGSLSWEVVDRIIREARAGGRVSAVCFTGGEPFLDMPLLARAVAACQNLSLEATVITNAFWARTVEKAASVLDELPGLTRLALSTDVFHQEFISVEYIENAVRAAHARQLECAVRVCHLDSPAEELERVRQQLIAVAGWYDLEHQPVQPLGRARSEVDYDRIFRFDTELACCRSADAHAINAQGELTACCGATGSWRGPHLLKFGDVTTESVGAALARAERSLVLHALRLWGPAGLLRLVREQAAEEGSALPAPDIHNICELCHFVVAHPRHAALLERAVSKPDVSRAIAVARLMDLGESGSLSALDEA